MPSTAPYAPAHTFGSDAAAQDMVNAVALDTELRRIGSQSAALLLALGISIRDDNTLTDSLVRIRNLHPELATWLQSAIDGTIATQSLAYRFPVAAASTGPIDPDAMFDEVIIDGVQLYSGDFLLLKDQADQSQNGLWEIHKWHEPDPNGAGLWVRRDDLLENTPCGSGWAVIVSGGTVNGGTAWGIVAGGDPSEQPVVSVDDLAFFPVFAPFPLPVARGGTGSSTAAGARANLSAAGKAVQEFIGDGSATSFSFAHGLGTDDVILACRSATGEFELPILYATGGQAMAGFLTPPPAGFQFSLIVIG